MTGSGRLLVLLLASTVLIGACGRAEPSRPREGAPVGANGQPAPRGEPTITAPTLVPVVVPGSSPPPGSGPGEPAPGGSPVAAASPSPEPVGGYVIVATDGAGANMREGPSTSARVITTVREGTAVEVIGDPVSSEGRSWRKIRSGGREGWVVAVVVRQR